MDLYWAELKKTTIVHGSGDKDSGVRVGLYLSISKYAY